MTMERRPDPDALLAKVEAEEERSSGGTLGAPGRSGNGRLKIFFGYSAGVGKTYAMLEAARALELKRGDVLVGFVQPHGRPETEALILGLELLSSKEIEYRGVTLHEFDLDAALRRKPKLILVDELAHTNAEGSTHPKRWQDIMDLLNAGIDVYTTLNVQHLESLNDVVGKITNITVRETVPDSVFDRADEVELVDLPPDELLERFREGKVYIPEQATRAADRFFRKDTLVALRELALRKTAEHVNTQVELGRRGLPSRPIWATRHRLMVAVGPSPTSARLIRATRRMATELRAPWFAVSVQRTTAVESASDSMLERSLQLAERLGAEVVNLRSDTPADALIAFAQDRGITRLVVGKTSPSWWRWLFRRSLVDAIIRRSGDLDVLVIRGEPERQPSPPRTETWKGAPPPTRWLHEALLVATASLLALAVGLGLHALGVREANIVLVFVLGVALIAYFAQPATSVVAAVLTVALFNFFFTEPLYTFVVKDPGYIVTFGVMLFIGLVISRLVGRVRSQERAAGRRADANDILVRVSRRLGSATGHHQVADALRESLKEYLKLDTAVFLPDGPGAEIAHGIGLEALVASSKERAVAEWVHQHHAEAGRGTDTLPNAEGWYLPLASRTGEVFGVLGIGREPGRELSREARQIVASIVSIASQCLERESLTTAAHRSAVEAETERFRSDLLATVSHDLRTPLSTISGAASAVLHSTRSQLADDDREMLMDAITESDRLTRLIENLLYLGRIERGRSNPRAEWQPLDELIDAALKQVGRTTDVTRIRTDLPDHPVMLWADGSLMTQVLINLLENATRYAPEGTITIGARERTDSVRIEVTDEGPGFGSDPPHRLFGRFVRGAGAASRSSRGIGLGLAICRAIVEAHGGSIEAMNRPGGGALLRIDLPAPPTPADSAPMQEGS